MINFVDGTAEERRDADENPLKEWKSKFEIGNLTTSDFINYFKKTAPNFFEISTDSEPGIVENLELETLLRIVNLNGGRTRCNFNESLAKTAIIDVLEEFICGDNPQNLLEKLKLEGHAPSVCGRVFKVGEPTYSCRECGMDPTCVLCVNCFKQSAHRYHKYKMSTSNGGGCCDCGDIEAWKKDPYCDEHIKGKELTAESSVITSRMKDRCEICFKAILKYCVKCLEMESKSSSECLEDEKDENIFCTVLYNDESHTFEQVIQTLTKIVKCQQKDAMEYVSSIDREGRAVVKCDSIEACSALKEKIEKQQMRPISNVNKFVPLKVSVLHKSAVSCQQFALQLLTWFQEFLSRHITFRAIFAKIAVDHENPEYNIGHILEYDWKLWKTARSCWHRLLISGMLMEYENKKILAIEFSKHYSTIIQDFIRDDHDYGISVVSLSVQLFTVPTIAHYLIANESIFYKLVQIFYWESIDKYVQKKTLHFAKNTTNLNIFKRAAYILYDLRYILSFKPDVWTQDLRDGFVDGVQVLLKLLNVMQGMDAVSRQTGDHMDYEPEWESAFNLHIKLAGVISLVLEWCSTDKEVLKKVYQMVIRNLNENEFIVSEAKVKELSLSGHVARCQMYDVSSQSVSIHLPLSRFFAGVYLHLGKFGLNFDNATTITKRTPEEIIEPVLCTQTMIGQVHAGMWRRNGYSLLHQLYFYRNVKCRVEMLDRDIAALQIGAALIESNQYLIHILNKFDLLGWVSPTYETSSTNNTDDECGRKLNMIDEFLELLIVIIGERYVPGIGDVTDEDHVKKEIIQQLCIKSFSHSELSRSLSDTNNAPVFEDVIESVAVFTKPSKAGVKVVYELKEEFFEDYNMYFYHYTKEERSKSEESQRLRRKAKEQLVCCPPPKLPKLTDGFVSIANLLQCDVMLTIVKVVLERALDLTAKSFAESHLQKILHLIGYGLQEEESNNYPFLSFYDRAVNYGILQLLEKLTTSARVETHRDFIIWVVKKFKELQPKVNSDGGEMESEEVNQPMTTAEAEKYEKEERARLAADKRAKIMAQMAKMQNNFMKSNAELFASTSAHATFAENMDWQEEASNEFEPSQTVACLGPRRKFQSLEEETFKCILCSEDCVVNKDGPCLIYSAFIQKSKVLLAPDREILPSPYIATCGHVMHYPCWKEYYEIEIAKETRRPNRNRNANNLMAEKKEFLCPYCRCLCNAIIPVTPALSLFCSPIPGPNEIESDGVLGYDIWVSIMQDYLNVLYALEQKCDFSEDFRDSKTQFPDIEEIVRKHTSLEKFTTLCRPQKYINIDSEWLNAMKAFMSAAQRVSPYPYTAVDTEPFLILWNACSYTIQSLEMQLRAIDKPFKKHLSIQHSSCLSGLIRVCGMLGVCADADIAEKLLIHVRGVLETVFQHGGPSIVEWDAFNILTSLVFMFPAVMYASDKSIVIPSGSNLEYYFLQLMFLGNIAKAIVLYRTDDTPYMDVDALDDEYSNNEEGRRGSNSKESQGINIVAFYEKYNLELKEIRAAKDADDETQSLPLTTATYRRLIDHIKDESIVFLRCSCLLFHFMTDTDFPEQFNEVNGHTFEAMCNYLGLNIDLETYFSPDSVFLPSMEKFACHPDIINYDPITKNKANGKPFDIVPCVSPVRQLVSLPDDYSDLINSVSDFTCPNNGKEESRNPSMCLVCGKILCAQSYCCQPELEKSTVGACTHHAHYCGAGVGVFLRIRDCEILLLGFNKGGFVSTPYLDEYGETDQGLRRGNPLRLCRDRYNKLSRLWLSHGLHEQIARLNENMNSGMQWLYM